MARGAQIKFAVEDSWLRNEYITKKRRNSDLCAELGCSMPTLLRILKRAGIEARDDRNAAVHHGRRSVFDLVKATKLYVDNEWNADRIGELLGVNGTTILRRLRESGVKIRHHNDTKRGRPNHRRIDLDPQLVALEYAKQDADIKSLEAMFGVTKSIIRRALDAAGVETKKRDRDGVRNPNWRPDLTAEERSLRRDSAKHAKWRIQVYERDGYKCQRCSDVRGGNLNAHHVEAHCQNKSDRHNPDNGVTLCVTCHRGFHSRYGFRDFGRAQLSEWLADHLKVAA